MKTLNTMHSDVQAINAHKQRLLVQLGLSQEALDQLLRARDSKLHSNGIRWDKQQYLLDDLEQELTDICEKIIELQLHFRIG